MAAKLLTSQLHLKLELTHNETCRTLRLEIAAKTLMTLSSSLVKVDDNREIIPGWNCLNFLHVFEGYQPNFP